MQVVKLFPDPIWKAKFPGRLDKIIERANAYKTQKEVVNNVLLGEVVQRYNFKDNPHEWSELKEFNNAVPYCEKGIELNPNHVEGYNHLGNIFKELREFKNN